MRLVGSILCAALLVALPAHAGPTLPEAKAAYQEGLRQYNAEHFAEAAQQFERSYALQGRPLLLFNIAQCQRKMGAFERAIETYRRYLTLAGPTDPPATVADARGYVAELEAYLARQRELAARPVAPPPRVDPPRVDPPRADPPRADPPRVDPPRADTPPPPVSVVPSAVVVAPVPVRRPIYKSAGLWAGVGIGAAVVIGLGVGLGVGLRHDSGPETTLGTYTPRYP